MPAKSLVGKTLTAVDTLALIVAMFATVCFGAAFLGVAVAAVWHEARTIPSEMHRDPWLGGFLISGAASAAWCWLRKNHLFATPRGYPPFPKTTAAALPAPKPPFPSTLQLLELLDSLDGILYSVAFHYFGDAKTSLAGARARMSEALADWDDDDARLVREWLEHAYPDPLATSEKRAAHMAFDAGKCRDVVMRRLLLLHDNDLGAPKRIISPSELPVSVRIVRRSET